jgi:sugar lactone lactonase YvrE
MCEKALEVVTDHSSLLGEGPVWDAANKQILWIDILKGEIHQYVPEKKMHKTFKVNQMIGAIALRSSGGIVAALQHGFALIDLEKETVKPIADPEAHLAENRFNDGKCDAAGRFWAGTMSVLDTPEAGSLYVLDSDLSVSVKIQGVGCSNGIAWSPDGSILYYIDTLTRQVAAFDYDVIHGNISNKRTVINIPEAEGYPDGMTIDTEGMLWIAMWDGWKVARYNPGTGKLIQNILLPVSKVTSCTFGGEKLQDLYITSAKTGLTKSDLSEQPLAGCLFVIKNCGFTGMEASRFQG